MTYSTPAERWRMWEISLLALTLWREARGESFEAKVAVAHSIKNRVDRPTWWGQDWVSVLTKKWQYSSLTDPKDRQLTTWPKSDDASFVECLNVAEGVRGGYFNSPLKGADSYYDDSIAPPSWATPETFVGTIGRLHFHNLDRDLERARLA
jgi:spore germination cell wall hydrolase CwlJ-like protein